MKANRIALALAIAVVVGGFGYAAYRSGMSAGMKMAGTQARLVPWLQDFSLGRTYTAADVAAQVAAARRAQTGGFMLWNAAGLYTPGALAPGPALDFPDLGRPGL